MTDHSSQLQHFFILGPASVGKTTALSFFRQFGYTTVDDLFPVDLKALGHQLLSSAQKPLAIGIKLQPEEVENTLPISQVLEDLSTLRQQFPVSRVLFLDAPAPALVKRFMDSGKPHPFAGLGLEDAVRSEKATLDLLKKIQDYSLDTANLPKSDVQRKIAKLVGYEDLEEEPFTVYLTSFAYKKGLPADADLVIDARFLNNPFYVDELRPQTGLDPAIRDYVFSFPETQTFFRQWTSLMDLLLPLYHQQGKSRITIAFGCTGGKHRSVCLAEALADHITSAMPTYHVVRYHRERDSWPSSGVQNPVHPNRSPNNSPSLAVPQGEAR